MGIWEGLDKAQVFDRGVFMDPGMFDLEIKNCLDKQTRKSGQAYIVEFIVLRTSNPAKYPIGSTTTWFQSMKDRDVAFGAVKEFLAGVYGYNLHNAAEKAAFDKDVNPSLPQIADASVAQGFLNGKRVFVETQATKTQKGADFTRHLWAKYDPNRVIVVSAPAVVPAAPAGVLPGIPGIPGPR